MGNESEKDFQPQQSNTSDQSKKNPSQGGSSGQRDQQDDVNQEKRRAS